MRPTLGDIVLYTFPSTSQDGQSRQVPAIIVAVHTDDCVNLRVFQDGERPPLWVTSVMERDSRSSSDQDCWEFRQVT